MPNIVRHTSSHVANEPAAKLNVNETFRSVKRNTKFRERVYNNSLEC